MITKNEMLSIPAKIKDIEQKRIRCEVMKEKLYSPRGLDTDEKVQSSGGESAALVDIVIDMEQDLDRAKDELRELRERAAEAIQRLPDEPRYIMKLRYLDEDSRGEPVFRSWSEIAGVMFYSPATMYRKEQEAHALLFGGSDGESY